MSDAPIDPRLALKKAITADRDLLQLLDRMLAEARGVNAALALETVDIDSFMPYTHVVLGDDMAAGIPIPAAVATSTEARGPWFGTFRGDADGAFIATHVNACWQGETAVGPTQFVSLYETPAGAQWSDTSAVPQTPVWDIRLTDADTGRRISRVDDRDFNSMSARPLSAIASMSPDGNQLVAPFTLPRDAAIRVQAQLSMPRTLALLSDARLFVVLHGYKIIGDR